jgi:NTE family protein
MRTDGADGIGLALSGGAARGFAHIGVVKVLQEHDVPIDHVAGTSAGSIVGALLCSGYGWKEMVEVAHSLKWPELVAPTLSGMGLVRAEKLEQFMGDLLGEGTFEELKTPFKAVAVDIASGQQVVISSGSVARAVRASTAVPGIFEPLIEENQALVDGGVINNFPVDVAKEMGASTVIGVDLNAQRAHTALPVSLLDVTYRSFAVLLDRTSYDGRNDADILIQPSLEEFSYYYDLTAADELIHRGEVAAIEVLEQLERLA